MYYNIQYIQYAKFYITTNNVMSCHMIRPYMLCCIWFRKSSVSETAIRIEKIFIIFHYFHNHETKTKPRRVYTRHTPSDALGGALGHLSEVLSEVLSATTSRRCSRPKMLSATDIVWVSESRNADEATRLKTFQLYSEL